ncbi:hypothetical protein LTR86_009858 [Recurvomyces mirabilis]|nr:hypothetical protein LTR86_009858 [Recurvomyces mirabilis]
MLTPSLPACMSGNCGLALAHGLKSAGIKYAIFERDTEDDFYNRPRDWGMLLHWGAAYLERLLPSHLKSRIHEPRCDPFLGASDDIGPVPFVNALTGQVMAKIPIPGINRVSRMKLRRFLTQDEELNIEFGKIVEKIEDVDGIMRVMFRDGSIESGDLVVGCDGSHSKVREFLVGKEAAQPEDVGLTMINYSKSGYTADEARLLQTLHPVFKIAAHPDRPGNGILAALDISDPTDPTTWKFQNYIGWWGPPYAKDLQDPSIRMDFYRSFVSPFCEPFRTGALKLLDGELVPIYPGQQWAPTMAWDNHGGKVTLAGDAAHSMLPQRGQGLNNAIKDASEIVDAVNAVVKGGKTLAEAISGYEAEMKPRGASEVGLSFEQAVKARDQSTLEESPLFKQGWAKSGVPASASVEG